ncbi:hypothetical protein THAOC_04496 [Thalassiosira oceanica]|uniref:SUI1 domain-containing protein n=1 Tax=Thalassiosira oceanica TaxID=159749 RepID=K0T9T5_THAOC|nr:hypothetical protein THAOC_04496 [Thalassiosira oceanica]|eukprot:EJK73859.1 hypothetical protein THAOC_04496 [Thalassiosira oceanica]
MASVEEITTPVAFLYCGACGMPPEYCSYSPNYETHCIKWLKKNVSPADFLKYTASSNSTADGGEEGGEDAGPPPPSEPWTTKERLVAFYTKYQPDKLDGIDGILEKYAGKEDKLFNALVKKYGPEPDDPYYYGAGSGDEGDVADKMGALDVKDTKKRRGAAAKKVKQVDTRVVVQKISRNRKKAVTHVVGMDTVPGIKLKEASKAFSKRFAGSSSVKDKEIIIQGDHLEDVAEMIVNKFGVSGECVFLDLDGEFVAFV